MSEETALQTEEPKSIINPDGTFSENWNSVLKEEYRNADLVKNTKDINSLVSQAVNYQKEFGARVKIPAADAKPEEWEKFYAKSGRPESAEKYEVKLPEKLPEGMLVDKDFIAEAKVIAFKNGWNQNQFKSTVDWYLNKQIQQFNNLVEGNKRLNEERWTKLKTAQGEEKTKEDIEIARRAFNEVAPDELKEMMTADEVASDPLLVQLYSKLWRKTMDDKLVKGEQAETKEYKPAYPNSPEMYKNDNSEEGKKAREYFTAKGHRY